MGGGGGELNCQPSGWKHTTYHSITFLRLSFVWKYILPLLMEKKMHAMESKLGGLTQEAKEKSHANF